MISYLKLLSVSVFSTIAYSVHASNLSINRIDKCIGDFNNKNSCIIPNNYIIAISYVTGIKYQPLNLSNDQLSRWKDGFRSKLSIDYSLKTEELSSSISYFKNLLESNNKQYDISELKLDPYFVLGFIIAQKFISIGLNESNQEIFIDNFSNGIKGQAIKTPLLNINSTINKYIKYPNMNGSSEPSFSIILDKK